MRSTRPLLLGLFVLILAGLGFWFAAAGGEPVAPPAPPAADEPTAPPVEAPAPATGGSLQPQAAPERIAGAVGNGVDALDELEEGLGEVPNFSGIIYTPIK